MKFVKSVVKTCSAFSLVELLIVVAILGILAAIVVPEFQGHSRQAKEAAAKDNLRVLRQAIERYEIMHGAPPGYLNNNASTEPFLVYMLVQLIDDYLLKIPRNPLNGKNTFRMVKNNEPLPAAATGEYGWIYKAKEKMIKLDYPGTDSEGNVYYDY